MFGDVLLVAPIVSAANNTTSLASKSIWLPPGVWFEITTSMVYQSPESLMVTKDYDLTEIPLFVPAGSVVPMRDLTAFIGAAMQPYTELGFAIFPGASAGSGAVYEDDGMSVDYVTGTYAWTNCTYSQSGGTTLVTITTTGEYVAWVVGVGVGVAHPVMHWFPFVILSACRLYRPVVCTL
jgi:alpha-glucosidase (family GH31 glycosyl hydrolase)